MLIVDKIREFINKPKHKKAPLRDKYGRPYYLQSLPIYARYPRTFLGLGSVVVLGTILSKPIYDTFFLDRSTVREEDFYWPSELRRGKRQADLVRERRMVHGDSLSFNELLGPYNPKEHKKMLDDFYAKQASAEERIPK